MADDADPAVGAVEPTQILGGSGDIADQSFVGHAARSAHCGGRVVWVGTRRFTRIQIGSHDLVAVDRQSADELLGLAVISRHVVDPHDAAAGSRCKRYGSVRFDVVSAVTGDGDSFRSYRIGAD